MTTTPSTTLNHTETLSSDAIARLLDHAILVPTATDAQMHKELESLRPYPLASVCIKPYAVTLAKEMLAGTPIGIGTVIGFPHGSPRSEVKAFETERAFADGAAEVDMVVNVGKVLSDDWEYVQNDINAVLRVVREHKGLLKVIFETDYLPDDTHKIRICEICSELGVDYVKTSTGFGFSKGADGRYGYNGATEHDIKLMRQHCAASVGVKASGGVRTLEDALKYAALGATRLGTTSTHAILKAAMERTGQEVQSDGAVVASEGY